MGLTRKSVGINVIDSVINIDNTDKKIIALAGNPNVGKSTLFNSITGMHQHTGNWPGKTVMSAVGEYKYNNSNYVFVDLPGCYSLSARSPEEEVAKEFICSGKADYTIVVCDATSLEKNLNLVLQIREITPNVIVCVNLMDEAEKKNILLDITALEEELNTKVLGITAYRKNSVEALMNEIERSIKNKVVRNSSPVLIYPKYIEEMLFDVLIQNENIKNRYDALLYIEENYDLFLPKMSDVVKKDGNFNDDVVLTVSKKASSIAQKVIKTKHNYLNSNDYKIDKLLTGRFWGIISMFFLLIIVFWITIYGANYLSNILSRLFLYFEEPFYKGLRALNVPLTLCNMAVYGVYRVLTWIISVMLPPMAIFFPLFTFLEDVGILPRIAFNLDKCFKNCNTCGKQALTMCMGFGCNAAGVVGCRIIDSKRERIIAILTNTFVPCNGRFPAIIAIITMFFISESNGFCGAFLSAVYLSAFILISVGFTLGLSKLLSLTLLKGKSSAFILELPSYRKPQIRKIVIRSIFDRTLFVLGRAVSVAAPAGLLIWIFANVNIKEVPIIMHISNHLDPLGRMMGLDGVILTAFVLGFPANEIIIPLIMMIYASTGVITDAGNLQELKSLLVDNGWTFVTALNTIIFMLMHWPCSTTCLTVKSETKSIKWMLVSFLLPTLCGITVCVFINLISKMI